jgi:alkanesulfonate monooxygenase SsuD/methylene tetrahydromethanopterin reductase-like flavin-dependent oxidoreductase (luciferase family)
VKVGVTSWFCNVAEWQERIQAGDFSRDYPVTDSQQLDRELYLADLVEPLGFDSFWTIEHHFSPYGMTTNPTQLLTYVAARTSRIELGTMVLVLPWHQPLRLAESISVLDNVLKGRRLNIGMGRGFAAREYSGFGISYDTSRERMLEVLDILRTALTREYFSYDGTFFEVPRAAIRPRPRTQDLTTNMLMTWASPESLRLAAGSGLAPLFTNLHGIEPLKQGMATFNEIRAQHGWGPSTSAVAITVFCHEDQQHAHEYATHYWRATTGQTIWHYDRLGSSVFMPDASPQQRLAAIDAAYESQTAAGIFGTPEYLIERIREIQAAGNVSHLITLHSFGDMPVADVERSMKMFAAKVLPAVRAIPAPDLAAVSYLDLPDQRTVGV